MSVPTQTGPGGHRPPASPYPEDPTTATRHLCAGAYLDETFRNDSLRKVYYRGRRLVAPSFGFDVVPVLAHCLRARNGAMVRDGLLITLVVVAAFVSRVSLLVVLAAMILLQLLAATWRLARNIVGTLRRGEPIAVGPLVARVALVWFGWSMIGAGVFLYNLARQAGSSGSYGDLYGNGYGSSGYAASASGTSGSTGGVLLLALLIFGAPVVFNLWRQVELSRMAPGARITQPVRTARLDEIGRQQRGNTTVYSGYRPYVGAGDLVETWGFAQRLVRATPPLTQSRMFRDATERPREHAREQERRFERDREFEQPPFDAQELVDYVRAHLSMLLPQREAEEHIAGLSIQDRVLLAGTEVSQLVPYTSPEMMAAVVRHPTSPARHYLACQVFAWGGELITTVHVHIAVQGRSLYLELTTTALPPCDERYRVVDTVEGHGTMAWLRAFRHGLAETPRTLWRAPVNLVGTVINMMAGSSSQLGGSERLVRGYDYGAQIGVREMASRDLRFLTQSQDVDKYKKLIERRVVAAVLDFLDDRDVDTTEYRARATAILNVNNGLAITGDNATFHGAVVGGDMTVGAG